MKSDAVLNLRIPVEVKDALANAARDDMRSMSGMAVRVIADWLSDRGYLVRDARRATQTKPRRTRGS